MNNENKENLSMSEGYIESHEDIIDLKHRPVSLDDGLLRMPAVALRGTVMFPGSVLHFDAGRTISVLALRQAMKGSRKIFLITQKSVFERNISIDTVCETGVVCEIKQLSKSPEDTVIRAVVEGKYRANLKSIDSFSPYLTVSINKLWDEEDLSVNEIDRLALLRATKKVAEDYSYEAPRLPAEFLSRILDIKTCGELADYIASNIQIEYSEKQKILDELDVIKRLELLKDILLKEIKVIKVEKEIHDKVQSRLDQNQRDYYLREQMKEISAELGEGEDDDEEDYATRIKALKLNEESEEKLLKDCKRLSEIPTSNPDGMVLRSYLDKVLELPWNKFTKDNLKIDRVRKALDHDHYGMQEVKNRIIELVAVRNLTENVKGQIICLVGPPGVGKTSIAKSLAKALNRKYERLSLGGVSDEAEIRGHRKTYIGSMPGAIIEAMIRAKSKNPLILLDEVDKLGSDYKGDPSSALLEALDPEQNTTFRDHYLEIPFDLSKVLFLTTANDASLIPAPLFDRMDVIELPSYTAEEKFNIAKKHLIKKQLEENGLTAAKLRITDSAIRAIIENYTREAGVRCLERTFAKIMRKEAVKFVSGESEKITVKSADLEKLLGAAKYKSEDLKRKDSVGIVNGLAWTSVGGDMLKVEAVTMKGTGKLELTGSLGSVMKESAQLAYSYIRSISDKLPIDENFYKTLDLHVHFPEGAVPKDGPSAGITITTAIVSALTGKRVRSNIAMTGEITLTGNVLAIGGLREKAMAAYTHKIDTVIIPAENIPDLDKVDEVVKKNIKFIPVKKAFEVLDLVLVK